MIQLPAFSILLMLLPFIGGLYVLLRRKEEVHSPMPFIAGAAFILLARILDVPCEVPGFRFLGTESSVAHSVNLMLLMGGDIADAVGIGFLVVGFYRTVEFLKRRHFSPMSFGSVLPVCAWCKKIKTADNTWVAVEEYIEREGRDITHGVCPVCSRRMREDVFYQKSLRHRFTSDAGETFLQST